MIDAEALCRQTTRLLIISEGPETPLNTENFPVVSSPWNSLEAAKLFVSTSTTIAIFVVGYFLQTQQAQISYDRSKTDRDQAVAVAWHSKLIEKRMELWDRLGNLYAKINVLASQPLITTGKRREIEWLSDQTTQLSVAYQLYFTAHFTEAIDGYDDVLDRRLAGRQGGTEKALWAAYKSLRRAAARDISLDVDKEVLSWEGIR